MRFAWTGRGTRGDARSGQIDAASKSEALEALQLEGIAVMSIKAVVDGAGGTSTPFTQQMLPGHGWSGFFVRLVFAFATLAGSVIFLMFTSGADIRCTRDRTVDCSVVETKAVFYELYAEQLPKVTGSSTGNRVAQYRDSKNVTYGIEYNFVVLHSKTRNVRSPGLAHALGASNRMISSQLNTFIASQDKELHAWQVEWIPLAMSLALFTLTLVFLRSAVRRLRG
ncbi:MAG: hypothetical protein JJE51_01135 [Thermoanaerobaculia bacterium]|nr:hypothetical protein [Thermoanaerobaculia bacterium]